MSTSLARRLAVLLLVGCLSPVVAQDSQRRRNVAFVVWEGIELIEWAGSGQIFDSTPGFDEYTVAETRTPITSYFVTIVPDYTFADCPKPDIIIVGGGGKNAMRSSALIEWLRSAGREAEVVMSVCTGSIVLAQAGLLDGLEATGPDSNLDDIMILGKNVKGLMNRRFVDAGRIITTQSYFAGVDGALHLLSRFSGEDVARRVAERNQYDWRPEEIAAQSAQPGEVPKSRRREVFGVLKREGVEAAVSRYHQMVAEDPIGYSPQLARMSEENLFQFLAWTLQSAGRAEDSVKLCQFMTRVFPASIKSRVALGEACSEAGETQAAFDHLFGAAEMDPGNTRVAQVLKEMLMNPGGISVEASSRAREIIRRTASASTTTLTPQREPGEPLMVSGIIRDGEGKPVAGALVYVFHTDASGYYSLGGMDEANPRLFGYMKTGSNGGYEFRTIRPGHYPDQTEPVEQHIHYEVSADGFTLKRHRLALADDPIWNRPGLAENSFWRNHLPLPPTWAVPVTSGPDGIDRCVCDIVLKRQ